MSPRPDVPFVLTCPRISPQWELAARLALVKPKPYTKSAVVHGESQQRWPRNARQAIESTLAGFALESIDVQFPRAGDDRLIIAATATERLARRLARAVSRRFPGLWFTLTPSWYVRDGEFYRRCGKYKLELVRTTDTRLRRSIRFGFLGDVDDAIAPARD